MRGWEGNKAIKRVLALDIATTTGWACSLDCGSVIFGSFTAGDKADSRGRKLANFDSYVHELIEFHQPHHLIIEAPFMRGKGTRLLFGLCCVAEMLAHEYEISFLEASNATVKNYATGHTDGGKEAVIKAVESWGYAPKNDHEADALALLHLVIDEAGI